ncbi:MAG: hypothetical protein EHM39_04295 [Chloroflexi bacterium]|nr:MAG: hypothetical protein EHM39_04295 [Chloroflexota bacterium]
MTEQEIRDATPEELRAMVAGANEPRPPAMTVAEIDPATQRRGQGNVSYVTLLSPGKWWRLVQDGGWDQKDAVTEWQPAWPEYWAEDPDGIAAALELANAIQAEWDKMKCVGHFRLYWHIVTQGGGLWSAQVRTADASESRPWIMPVHAPKLADAIVRIWLIAKLAEATK